ncbi:NAD binding domain of 6-phosphogluconate dehydrogenase-domain-containing protein [Syncephalis fuscata]|nr:NAD binding domain of 6-phosphogluconate dehydrogenase-domain-containing protein [Syncephalis fuscata]
MHRVQLKYFVRHRTTQLQPLATPLTIQCLNNCRHYSSSRKLFNNNNNNSKPTIGFIGLGQMGFRMANNILKKSKGRFVIHDAAPAALEHFRRSIVEDELRNRIDVPGSSRAVAEQADIIITMLPESDHVHTAYCGEGGILEGLKKGALCIDSSTIAPAVSKTVSTAVIEQGGGAIDAPVSGGVGGAQAGTLTFMVGGSEADFNAARPYLQAMGKNIVHCGGISMLGTAETMRLGVRLGMDPNLLAGVLNTSTGRCWSSDTYNPYPGVIESAPSSLGYEGGFATPLMAKDMRLAVEAAAQSHTTILLGSTAAQVYGQVSRTPEIGNKDFSVVYKWISQQEPLKE